MTNRRSGNRPRPRTAPFAARAVAYFVHLTTAICSGPSARGQGRRAKLSANPRPGGNGLDDPQGHVLPGAGNTVEINGDIYNICQPREVHFHQAPSERSGEDVAAQRERRRWKSALPSVVAWLFQLWFAIVLLNLAFGTVASAQPQMRVVGTWGGAVNAVFVDEANPDIAYVGAGRRLVILNVADPANILELGSIDLGNLVMDLKVRNGYAYVCTFFGPNSFCVVDVSDPARPQLAWASISLQTREVELYNNAAYVRQRSSGINVFDITNPESPQALGWIAPPLDVDAMDIEGDLLYVGTDDRSEPGLRIYDLSADPFAPPLLGEVLLGLPAWHDPREIVVRDNRAYIVTPGSSGGAGAALTVVDVSNPQAPVVAGASGEFYWANDVSVNSRYAYVADWAGSAAPGTWPLAAGLVVVDVNTNPANPTVVGTFRTHGTVRGVEVVGDRAYLSDDGEGLIILDISGGDSPVRLGSWHSPSELRKMHKVGDLLYVTDAWNGVTILDVSNADAPALLGVYQTEETGRHMDHWDVEVRGELAYFSAGYAGLEVLDVSDPAQPTLAGAFLFNSNQAIALRLSPVRQDIVHVGVKGAYIVSFNISNLGDITEESSLYLGGVNNKPYSIEIDPFGVGHVAVDLFIAAANLADPGRPELMGTQAPWSGRPYNLVLDGNTRYVGNADSEPSVGGFYVQDVSDPANPVNLGHFPSPRGGGIAVQNDRAYQLMQRSGGITLVELDVADPAVPALLRELVVPGGGYVLVDGRFAYVTGRVATNGAVGLSIIELAPPCPADLNGDGSVDLADLGILLADFGCQAPGPCPGDIDGDGDTDLADLGILLSNFGQACP